MGYTINGRNFADYIFKWIFLGENWKIFTRDGPIDNKSPMVHVMAWRRIRHKAIASTNGDPVHWRIDASPCLNALMEATRAWHPTEVCHLGMPSIEPVVYFTNGLWAHKWNLVKTIFAQIVTSITQSVSILHMSQQLSCRDMCKIVTSSDHDCSRNNSTYLCKI